MTIPDELRISVFERASGCCEYCRLSLNGMYVRFEVDHVIAEKHDGPTTSDNLALSCMRCNRRKGSDISSFDWDSKEVVPLYNPRLMRWEDHFELLDGWIGGKTLIGRVTAKFLMFNTPNRVDERRAFTLVGTYPCTP